MNTADIIDRAADLIWLRGRCIGERHSNGGSLCVLGALQEAANEDVWADLMLERLVGNYLIAHPEVVPPGLWRSTKHLRDTFGYVPAYRWNDSLPVNTENDALVVDTLRRCAKSLREAVA